MFVDPGQEAQPHFLQATVGAKEGSAADTSGVSPWLSLPSDGTSEDSVVKSMSNSQSWQREIPERTTEHHLARLHRRSVHQINQSYHNVGYYIHYSQSMFT